MSYRITAVRVLNFKRLRHVEITPDSDAVLMLIAGKNAQGKSSLLDALTTALGGKRAAPADPVRHGSDKAAIDLEFNSGELVIRRVMDVDGESKLEVREKGSVIRSPQARLDAIIGSRFLDPLSFLALPSKDQRAQLLAMFDRDGEIAKLEERRERIFAKRRDVGRDLTKAQGELARLPAAVKVAAPIDVAALSAERAAMADKQRAGDGLGLTHREAEGKLQQAVAELGKTEKLIADLEQQLAAAMDARDDWAEQVQKRKAAEADAKAKLEAARKEWAETTPRREQLDADLKRAGEHNRAVFEAEATNKRRAAAEQTVKELEQQTEQQTELLAKIETQKLEVLAKVGLPVAELGISADGLTLAGIPFAQSSAAERLRVALALAMAASPGLDDIWIRDGALLDEDSLQLLADQADAAGKRLWIERVSDRDPGAIVIHDGAIREEAERAAG